MSDELATTAPNAFERIKRVNDRGGEFWSARELAKTLEYSDFRNFITVINKARQACTNSGRPVPDHFVDITEMVGIGSGAWRPIEDWANQLHEAVGKKVRQTIQELGGTMPEHLPIEENIKKIERRQKRQLKT